MRFFRMSPSERAEKLLLTQLTSAQRRTYRSGRYIRVTGSKGHLYCIHLRKKDWIEVVFRVSPNGRHEGAYCTYIKHPATNYRMHVPGEDELLTYKLLIESDEATFTGRAPYTEVNERCSFYRSYM